MVSCCATIRRYGWRKTSAPSRTCIPAASTLVSGEALVVTVRCETCCAAVRPMTSRPGHGPVRERLAEIVETTGAQEIMATTVTHDVKDRLRSFELLAQAMKLSPRHRN